MNPFATLRARLADFGRDRSGSVAIISAIFGICLTAGAAVSVDVSSVYLQRRREQGALDLAALAAARDLANAERTARATLAANGLPSPKGLVVTLGAYVPNPQTPSDKRFTANAAPRNAVRLEMTNDAPVYFGRNLIGSNAVTVTSRSTAANTRIASFSIGSRLASLNGGVANALLSSLIGASISLNAMDYDALANVNVDIPTFLSALGPRVGVTAGTYDDVLSSTPTVSTLAAALSQAGGARGLAGSALASIVSVGSSRPVNLRQMISLGPFAKLALGTSPGLTASASALDMLSTAAGIASAGRQVDLALGAQVPGLLGLTASLTIGERPQASPWLTMGAEGVSVRTAQTRLRLVTQVAGVGGLPALRLPVAIDLASGVAQMSAASCGANPRTSGLVSLAVTPSVSDVWVGEPRSVAIWNDMAQAPDVIPAAVLDALLVSATAAAHVSTTNLNPKVVQFTAAEIAASTSKTVATTDLLQSTLSSLTGNLQIQVKLLGITLGTTQVVTSLIGQALQPVGATLDPVLASLLDTLGVGLGEAVVTVRGLRCDGSTLVG